MTRKARSKPSCRASNQPYFRPLPEVGWFLAIPAFRARLLPLDITISLRASGSRTRPISRDGILGKLTGGPGKTSIRAAYGIYYTSIEDLNLFYEVGDAPFGLYWVSPQPVLFDQPFVTRADGSSQGQRFPFTFPIPGSPANKTLELLAIPADFRFARL